MTKIVWSKLSKEIDDKPKWNKELYKRSITDLDLIKWRIIYKDGTEKIFERKEYPQINRNNIKAIGLEGINVLLPVTNDVFYFRLRNLVRGMVGDSDIGFNKPKRCIVLYTENEVVWVWDDGDIDELPTWGDKEPYTSFELAEFEK